MGTNIYARINPPKAERENSLDADTRITKGEVVMIYNNDVGHCMGIDCPRKDECYRHWLYLEMHKHKCGAWVIPNGMWNNKECEDFINRH